MRPRRILLLVAGAVALATGASVGAAQDPPRKPVDERVETPDEPAGDDDAAKPSTAKGAAETSAPVRPIAIGDSVPADVTLLPVPEAPPDAPAGDETVPDAGAGAASKGRAADSADSAESAAAAVSVVSVVSLTRGDGVPPPAPAKPPEVDRNDDKEDGDKEAAASPQPAKPEPSTEAEGDEKPAVEKPPRPIVLLYWSRACPVAKRYVSPYAELAKDFGKQVGFHFVVANHGESPEEARQALADAGVSLRVFADPARATAGRFGIRVTPTALVLDAAGVLRYRGPIDDDRMAKAREPLQHLRLALTALLADKPIEGAEPRPFGSAIRTTPARR